MHSQSVLHNYVFSFWYEGGLFFNGGLYEILYYDSALNTSQSAVVQSYLAAKYNIDLYEE